MQIAAVEAVAENIEDFLIQYKYLTAIKRVARGVAHGYNNIFTGLGGQTAMLQRESAYIGDVSCERNGVIGELLQRGVEHTAILSEISKDAKDALGNYSPFVLAKRAVDLLSCISLVHDFNLVSKVQPVKLECNARDIVLVLFYLGENCVDATPEGGVIDLEICHDEPCHDHSRSGIVFSFLDHGPGFSETILPRLYEPFVTTKKGPAFSGLGLYAAQRLARRHNGQLTVVKSRKDDKTKVSAAFQASSQETVTSLNGGTEKKGVSLRPQKNKSVKQCFLVVEDDEAIQLILLSKLQQCGHMVFCVASCAEALSEYAYLHEIITTVIMDVGLPDNNGFECSKKILEINPQARIIFMSGKEETIPAGITNNAVFLQKPFTQEQLEEVVYDVHV